MQSFASVQSKRVQYDETLSLVGFQTDPRFQTHPPIAQHPFPAKLFSTTRSQTIDGAFLPYPLTPFPLSL
jgi:hypothetical protein